MDPVRRAIFDQLEPEERVNFLAIIMRMAAADGVSAQERDKLQPISQGMQASQEELTRATSIAFDETLKTRDLVGRLVYGDKSFLLYRECCAVAWVDGHRTEAEGLFLNELALSLGLSEDTQSVLDSPLACSPEGERRFLVLLGGSED